MRSLGLMTFMIPVGFSQACGITVGGFIGKGLEKALKYYYWTSMYLSVIVAGIWIIFFLTFKQQIIGLFTQEAAITEQMSLAWGIFSVFIMFDTT